MRPIRRSTLVLGAVLALAAPLPAMAQTSAGQTTASQTTPAQTPAAQVPAASGRLRVFLDCGPCFETFLREEIDWIDFVRQQQDADVQLLGTVASTGGGGGEVAIRFVGRGRFQGVDLELKSVSPSGDTEDMRRRRILRTVTIGLLTYVERAGQGDAVQLEVGASKAGAGQTRTADDPWKAWVFTLRGNASFNNQETSREWRWTGRATADRVTEQWILSAGAFMSREHQEFELDPEEADSEPFSTTRREQGVSWFLARGLNQHWSIGFQGGVTSSTFGNQRLTVEGGPAVEYNLFPYSDYASRQLRFTYAVGARHSRYNEITFYDKLRETNPLHSAEVTLALVQPWGELQTNFQIDQYLHDLSKYRVEVGSEASLRLTRGFSLNVDGSASRIRDQLSVPKRGATDEEVLLHLRQLLSGYEIDFSISLTYRFGSIFNNVVNPRFGRN